MTVTPCMPLEELATVAELPATDPRRAHVAQCPRCGALLDAYARFMDPGADAEATHVARADARLSDFLARTIGAPAESVPAPAPRHTAPDASWWSALFAPALRPALGLVVAAIVVGGVVLWPRHAEHDPSQVLRGGPSDANAPVLRVRSAGLDVDGLHVAWNAVPGADDYEVRIYSDRLEEMAYRSVRGDSALDVPAAELDFRPIAGQALLVRIDARGGGRLLTSSPPTPFKVSTLPD